MIQHRAIAVCLAIAGLAVLLAGPAAAQGIGSDLLGAIGDALTSISIDKSQLITNP